MKTMICNQLGGACDMQFHANTFDEMAEMSKKHGMEMFEKKDPDHLKAMEDMNALMYDPGGMQKWMDEKKQEFENLPEDK